MSPKVLANEDDEITKKVKVDLKEAFEKNFGESVLVLKEFEVLVIIAQAK